MLASLRGRAAEWERKQSKQPDWRQRNEKNDSTKEPSADKTLLELMCATNGGELWAVSLRKKAKLPHAHPAYLDTLLDHTGELPQCASCGLAVPGVLSLPCECDWHVCAECFRTEVKSFTAACAECGARRKPFKQWAATQPWLELQSEADREFDIGQAASTAAQVHLHHQNAHAQTILLRQPDPVPAPATI